MTDRIVRSAREGRVVLWEEVARDGAQAGTLMTAPQRIALARRQGAMFGRHGPDHLIFAAGFPAVAREEREIVRQLVDEVDNCALATHGRAKREDIDLAIETLAGATHGRVTFFLPVSDAMALPLLHRSAREALVVGLEAARYAVDRAGGLAVDVALADASRADPDFVAEVAERLTHEGVAVTKFCDSFGVLIPLESRRKIARVRSQIGADVTLGVHLHNDLGLGLANNLEALEQGVRVVASSWLGLGERVGLTPTEQLLFVLTTRATGKIEPRWRTSPDLHQLVPTARRLARELGVEMAVCQPIVGYGVNRWKTGTPLIAPEVFRGFDPEELLGVAPEVVLTHLTGHRVVLDVARRLGYELTTAEARSAMEWVKHHAYRRGGSTVSEAELGGYLADLRVGASESE